MCKRINCKQTTKKLHQNHHYQKMMRFLLKNIKKKICQKALENLETDTESKELKSRTKRYGKTRAAA